MKKLVKNVFIETNFNQKLGNDGFIHIDLAPAMRIPESTLTSTIIEMKTKDESHPPVQVVVDDLARFPFSQIKDLPSCLTWCSHAMHSWDLHRHILEKHQGIQPDTEFAIYFYKKAKNIA